MPAAQQPPRAEQCHCFLARRTARQITRFYDAHLHPVGLKITQFLTLAILNERPLAAITDLADRLDVDATAMGKMIATLERAGVVEVHRAKTDGRSRVVSMTVKGRARFEAAVPLWRGAQAAIEQANAVETKERLRLGLSIPAISPAA
ncbi:MarR family winged helix-turn-helix transcriptional regulator [Sphingomonas morindae]|uniref:MarR family winged helix-turn-helix transcriptional regulator n=1 Tax=Sphingomonas morindae TaxID=1541170 RepID=A0ABY4X9A0_9SPHN|nr:MarR family winged helix-turn-helix transcriptional regulator [Sphingomonas morindae]USI73458.1 MarR family winged helix-turn-helix transcriptional regulator [Sphingomonas morindae]